MVSRLFRQYRFGALMLGLLGPGFLWLILPALVVADSGQIRNRFPRFI